MSEVGGRLIPYARNDAPLNMAIDQALLESVESGGPMTLRLYGWSEPTLSLGYFQKLDSRNDHQESQLAECVRRATGGGAIVHHHELTYSIAMPIADLGFGRDDLYRRMHGAVIETLVEAGIVATPYRWLALEQQPDQADPFLCFQRRTDEDLVLSGYKILGSAQRRTKHAVLQHGSLLLSASRFAPQLPGINNLAARGMSLEQICDRLPDRVAGQIGVSRWRSGVISDSERARAAEISSERFANPNWLGRR